MSETSLTSNVSFSSLEIRSYNIIPGDAPTTSGPPISLDWDYDPGSTTTYDVNYYESFRSNEAPRRNKSELLMPGSYRREMLMSREWGYTKGQVDRAAVEARRVAEGRSKMRKNLKMQGVEEVIESTRRKFKSLNVLKKL
jgi:hypothetical protein